jgi:RNA polymerase sigma-70 factor (ECF subfamily)
VLTAAALAGPATGRQGPIDEMTSLLRRLARGDKAAEAELMPAVYGELKRVAAVYLRRERPDHTLQATALVHEAYLKLAGQHAPNWQDRSHFFAMAAKIMRRILTDHARQHRAQKRGSGQVDLNVDDLTLTGEAECELIQHLDEALDRLARFAPRQAKVVELRFFGGMTEHEIAQSLDICQRTVKRDWTVAKAWLYGELAS